MVENNYIARNALRRKMLAYYNAWISTPGTTAITTSMVIDGSRIIVNTIPISRLLVNSGTTNFVIGVDSVNTAYEMKNVVGTSNEIDITHTTGQIQIGLVDPLIATKGGTGQSGYTTGDILYASSATALSRLVANSTATEKYLQSVSSGNPSWVQPDHTKISNIGTLTHSTIDSYLDQSVKQAASPTFAGLSISAFTQGSVPFIDGSGLVSQDNANLFWNSSSKFLGIQASAPASPLTVGGGVAIGASYVTTAAPTNGLSVQGIMAVGSSSGSSKAMLSLSSTTRGFLPTRLTTAQRDAITSVPAGLMTYNTDTNTIDYYNNAAWVSCEPAIAAGSTAQYYRGDKTWQTLNQAAVTGLTIADSPTFLGLTLSSLTTAGILHNAVTTGVISSSLVVNADIDASAGLVLSKLATQADQTIVGNNSGGAAVPTAISATNLMSLNALAFASTSFVKMTSANTFGLDTNTYLTAVTAHDLLSAIHSDSLTASVVLGDIMHGNATPKWARLAGNITTTKKYLNQTGSGAISAVPVWDSIADADLPSTITRTSRTISTSVPITGGGDLTGDRTLALSYALPLSLDGSNKLYIADDAIGAAKLTINNAEADGYYLKWNATAGKMEWGTCSSAVAGSDTQVQYNDATVLAGAPKLIYNKTSGFVGVNKASPLAQLHVNGMINNDWMFYTEEFLGRFLDTNLWSNYSTGGTYDMEANATGGKLYMEFDGTLSSDYIYLYLSDGFAPMNPTGDFFLEVNLTIATVSSFRVEAGLSDGNPNLTTDKAIFKYSSGTGTNWYALTCDGSTVTTTDTTIAASTSKTILTIVKIGASVYFYIDGTLRATNTTNLPDKNIHPVIYAYCNTSSLRRVLYDNVTIGQPRT
jgi:hypothetical protein